MRLKYLPAWLLRSLVASSRLLTPRQAAEKLGVSYPPLKHRILAGRIKTIKTLGGGPSHLVAALGKFLPAAQALAVHERRGRAPLNRLDLP